ncbi:MAG: thiol peroxidase [Bacteroidia bacterium]|nr:thiol peroxidase [Bacteroidia bacterium]NNF31270.1 thiol peroxidase [Flavobacteriaceae bacterium]NNJ82955.1 thiol peroxidase [Flavobacteriaceae bacterium]NNK54535.1 thiol peroxidase [Flavobacteriaceae bacterium]NNM08307.1 thiol peroxidase [Flavobacteriaceae bacterium]
MAKITLGGNPAQTIGDLPAVGTKASDFKLTAIDMSTKTMGDFAEHKLLLNIFPSVNTGVCSASVRKFNEAAANMNNTKVLCISKDLPFAQEQFCAAEGIEDVVMLSDFKTGQFGKDYGVTAVGSAFDQLLSRAVVIVDESGTVTYTEQVPEIGQEPNYEAALSAL